MPRFFVDSVTGKRLVLEGENGRHAVKSLRMQPGEALVLCDGKGYDYRCRITEIIGDAPELEVEERVPSGTEPTVNVTLYQGLPKSDKMEFVIQKAVELGCCRIVPVETEFCIAKISGKEEKKVERWQKIALEAAKQSGRGTVPAVAPPVRFTQAVKNYPGCGIVLYEGGGEPLGTVIKGSEEISIFIGPEGGFSGTEVEKAKECGLRVATLGPRILRTETASLAALTAIMYETGNMD